MKGIRIFQNIFSGIVFVLVISLIINGRFKYSGLMLSVSLICLSVLFFLNALFSHKKAK